MRFAEAIPVRCNVLCLLEDLRLLKEHLETYAQSIGSLLSSMSDTPELLRPVVEYALSTLHHLLYPNSSLRAHLVAGTAQTLLSAHVILAVLSPFDESEHEQLQEETLFQKLSLSRSVAQKVLEGVGNEKPVFARVSRESKEILRGLHASGGDASLEGLF
jgi:hypothetical protein